MNSKLSDYRNVLFIFDMVKTVIVFQCLIPILYLDSIIKVSIVCPVMVLLESLLFFNPDLDFCDCSGK